MYTFIDIFFVKGLKGGKVSTVHIKGINMSKKRESKDQEEK